MRRTLPLALALACAPATPPLPAPASAPMVENPMLTESPHPLGYPAFDRVDDDRFADAFEAAMDEHRRQIRAIANNPEPPSFANTMVELERSGQRLSRVRNLCSGLLAADRTPTREAVLEAFAPRFAAHSDAIFLDGALFARLDALHENRGELDAESSRLLDRYHTDFVRAGARLPVDDKARLESMNAEIASLQAQFGRLVLAEVNDSAVVFDDEAELEGLEPAQIEAARAAAKERGLDGKLLLALVNTTGQPAMAQLSRRESRRRLHEASIARGSRGNDNDTTGIIARLARLRAERAQLLGYPDHASYVLEDETAKTPEAVAKRLASLIPPAVRNAKKEAADIERLLRKDHPKAKLEPWDWAYYAEKVRKSQGSLDEGQLRPYLELNRVLKDGVFFAATRLFGIEFREKKDLPVYHPDVQVFEVLEADGELLALFVFDPYARPSKRGGAWMNEYVSQSDLLGEKPVVGNHLNVVKPPPGEPTLMTWDEVRTAFHEFGHALHGMFSAVKYPYFAGTNVPRDFVEYPSQVNEMWASWPEVLENYARHHETGEPLPKPLLDEVVGAGKFDQGFATTEYLAASIIDQAFHRLAPEDVPEASEVMAFEKKALEAAGVRYLPVPPRYRTPYFSHVWGGGYSAGYYAYIWSEVLDADTVKWFEENGGLSRDNGTHFRQTLLSRGGSVEAMELYRGFRGRDAEIGPLLERRGLAVKPSPKARARGLAANPPPTGEP